MRPTLARHSLLLSLILAPLLPGLAIAHAADCQSPLAGEKIEEREGKLLVPEHPIIPYIPGDGIGPEIMGATIKVVNAAVERAYQGKRSLVWKEVAAGLGALEKVGSPLPAETLAALREYRVGIKGPTGTPTGGGFRSVNVQLRQELGLDSCVRPVDYHAGIPSPNINASKVKMVIFRENTEDVYSGIEFAAGSPAAGAIIDLIRQLMPDAYIDSLAAIGIKPMTEAATKTLMRRALRHALDKKLPYLTVVHKGNIMKETEGAFLRWSLEVTQEKEFAGRSLSEEESYAQFQGGAPEGKVVIKSRIADNMFQEIQLRPQNHNVIVTANLNGDYLSDAAAALVGGLGLAPGANIGENRALFEATHGTAPDIAGKNLANPSSTIKSAMMMLEYLGWNEARDLIAKALDRAFANATVTGDLGKMPGARILGTTEFAEELIRLQD
jgi:isocitrate dehydrogenase